MNNSFNESFRKKLLGALEKCQDHAGTDKMEVELIVLKMIVNKQCCSDFKKLFSLLNEIPELQECFDEFNHFMEDDQRKNSTNGVNVKNMTAKAKSFIASESKISKLKDALKEEICPFIKRTKEQNWECVNLALKELGFWAKKVSRENFAMIITEIYPKAGDAHKINQNMCKYNEDTKAREACTQCIVEMLEPYLS